MALLLFENKISKLSILFYVITQNTIIIICEKKKFV